MVKSAKQSTSSKKLVVDPSQRTLVFHDANSNKKSLTDGNGQKSKRILVPARETHSKTAEQEAYELMCQEEVSESYWQDYAEQRHLALAEALDENKELHEENNQLKTKVEELSVENELLKQDNETLSLLAEQADHLTDLLQFALGERTDVTTASNTVALEAGSSPHHPEDSE